MSQQKQKSKKEILDYVREPVKDYPPPELNYDELPASAAAQYAARQALLEVRKRIRKVLPKLDVYQYMVPAGTPTQGGVPHLLSERCTAHVYLSHLYDLHKAVRAKDWYWACRRLTELIRTHQIYDLRTAVAVNYVLEGAEYGCQPRQRNNY